MPVAGLGGWLLIGAPTQLLTVDGATTEEASGAPTFTQSSTVVLGGAQSREARGATSFLLTTALVLGGAASQEVHGAAQETTQAVVSARGATSEETSGLTSFAPSTLLTFSGAASQEARGAASESITTNVAVRGVATSEAHGRDTFAPTTSFSTRGISTQEASGVVAQTTQVTLPLRGTASQEVHGLPAFPFQQFLNAFGAGSEEVSGQDAVAAVTRVGCATEFVAGRIDGAGAVPNLGARAGDQLFAFVQFAPPDTVIAPAGWTLVRTDTDPLLLQSGSLYARVATDSEPSSYTWGVTGGSFGVETLLYRGGTASATPSNSGAANDGASVTVPTFTPAARSTIVNTITFFGETSSPVITSGPSGYILRQALPGFEAVYDFSQEARGPTGPLVTTFDQPDTVSVSQAASIVACDGLPGTGSQGHAGGVSFLPQVLVSIAGASSDEVSGQTSFTGSTPLGVFGAGTREASGQISEATSTSLVLRGATSDESSGFVGATSVTYIGCPTPFATFVFARVDNVSDRASPAVVPDVGAQPGDQLFAQVLTDSPATITAPPGWTLVRTDTNEYVVSLYARIATTNEATPYVWSSDDPLNFLEVTTSLYRGGIATIAPSNAGASGVGVTLTSPPVTTAARSTIINFLDYTGTAVNPTTVTPPAGYTKEFEETPASVVQDLLQTVAGSTGALTTTFDTSVTGASQTAAIAVCAGFPSAGSQESSGGATFQTEALLAVRGAQSREVSGLASFSISAAIVLSGSSSQEASGFEQVASLVAFSTRGASTKEASGRISIASTSLVQTRGAASREMSGRERFQTSQFVDVRGVRSYEASGSPFVHYSEDLHVFGVSTNEVSGLDQFVQGDASVVPTKSFQSTAGVSGGGFVSSVPLWETYKEIVSKPEKVEPRSEFVPRAPEPPRAPEQPTVEEKVEDLFDRVDVPGSKRPDEVRSHEPSYLPIRPKRRHHARKKSTIRITVPTTRLEGSNPVIHVAASPAQLPAPLLTSTGVILLTLAGVGLGILLGYLLAKSQPPPPKR